jgi:catechol 2,3-dioxygenase-like lactoylglutathione lyase family enzyme
MKIYSNITFFYYKDLDEAADFYENILGAQLIQDQKMAKIYKFGKSYFGIVDGERGSLKAQDKNAAMLTFLVDSVEEWTAYFHEKGVKCFKDISMGKFAHSSFFIDPGGYVVEFQRFLDEDVQKEFE